MKQPEATNTEEEQALLKTLGSANPAELAELARRCRAKSLLWLKNAHTIESWLKGSTANDKAH